MARGVVAGLFSGLALGLVALSVLSLALPAPDAEVSAPLAAVPDTASEGGQRQGLPRLRSDTEPALPRRPSAPD